MQVSESVSAFDPAIRARFYGIPAADDPRWNAARRCMTALLPQVMDEFYLTVGQQPEMATLLQGEAHIARLKQAQTNHWLRLLDGTFDAGFLASARKVGEAHFRIGLSADWYVRSYGLVLRRLSELLLRKRRPALSLLGKPDELASVIPFVIGLCVADMEFALGVYWQESSAERRHLIEGMIDLVDGQATDVIGSVMQFTDELQASVVKLDSATRSVRQGTEAAARANERSEESAQAVAEASGQLHQSIGEISQQVGNACKVVDLAVSEANDAREVIDQLGQAAEQIGGILGLIRQIASQTNLLALNATIEAARAGEAGKGFAVVAQEVNGLANQSARSAEEIGTKVEAIRSVADSAMQTIMRVANSVQQLAEVNSSIAAAIEQQAAATQEIARNVQTVANVAQDVAGLMSNVDSETGSVAEVALLVRGGAEQVRDGLESLPGLLKRAVRNSSENTERRINRRRPCLLEVEFVYEGSRHKAVMRNIAEGGALLEAEGQVATGSRIQIRLAQFGSDIAAQVVNTSRQGLHVSFSQHISAALADRVARETAAEMVRLTTADHVAFVQRVVSAVDEHQNLNPASLATHHGCRLGRWYDSVTDAITIGLPAYRELDEPHRLVHALGRDALAAEAAGLHAEAQAKLVALREASRGVINTLDRFEREFNASFDASATTHRAALSGSQGRSNAPQHGCCAA